MSRELEGGFGLDGGPPPLDLSAVPRTEAKRDELVTELAGLRYELANAFFLSLGRVDTAAALYRQILDDTPSLPVAIRAQYALAEIERAAGRDDLARPLYEAVAEADTSVLGQASRIQLGLEEPATAAPTRTTAAYDAIRQRWQSGDASGAAAAFIALGDADPEAADAPRAYFSAAAAYVEAVGADSLALSSPLPDTLVSAVLLVEAEEIGAGGLEEPVSGSDQPVPGSDEGEVSSTATTSGRDGPDPPAASEDRNRVVEEDELGRLRSRPGLPQPVPAEPVPAEPVPAEPVPAEPAVVDSSSFTLRHHLTALASRYPETPYAARSQALLALLPEPLPPPADTTATVSQDSLAMTPGVSSDSLAVPASSATPPDSVAVPISASPVADNPVEEVGAASVGGLRSGQPIDMEAGGFSWRVRTVTLAEEAAPMVRVLRDADFCVALLQENESGSFVIAIGQFGTEAEALAARPGLPAWAQLRGAIVDLSGYTLIETDEATGEVVPDPE